MKDQSLAVFVGQSFYRDASGFSTGESFIRFIESFSEVYGRITLLVRIEPGESRSVYPVDEARFRVVPLPFFDQFRPLGVMKALARVRAMLREELPRHGAVWVGGPHLVGREVVRASQTAGVPCFLVIRQNLFEQVRHKTGGPKKALALGVTVWIERCFRSYARRHPTFTVGHMMYQAYGGNASDNVHEICINLLRDEDIPASVPNRPARRPFRLLWVGRLSPEKGLNVLFDTLAGFSSDQDSPSLTLVGDGPQRGELEAMAERLGIAQRVRFAGYVPFGSALGAYYDDSDIFVLPSLTGEGLPQVLLEAMAAGVPCLASSVEGIPYFIEDGKTGSLVTAGDPIALGDALRALIGDEDLRLRLARAGLEKVRSHTLEAERKIMTDVLADRFGLRAER